MRGRTLSSLGHQFKNQGHISTLCNLVYTMQALLQATVIVQSLSNFNIYWQWVACSFCVACEE